jgi:hypothetical protein
MSVTENRKKWVSALRSGEYQQCKNRLTNGVGFCCLGVAASVLSCSREENQVNAHRDPRLIGVLKAETCALLGLACDLPGAQNTQRRFTIMNDHTNLTFNQIADEIEKLPEVPDQVQD